MLCVSTVTLAFVIWPWFKVTTLFDHEHQLCQIFRPYMVVRSYGPQEEFLYVCVHCDLGFWDMTLVQGHDTHWSLTRMVYNIIQIQHSSKELWPRHGLWVCVHCDINIGDIHCHGQQLCEILSISNTAARSYGLDTDFGNVCSDLDLGDMTLVQTKLMTHPWVMFMHNNCVKYYSDRNRSKKLRPWHDVKRRTDRQGDSYITTPPPNFPQKSLFAWGGGYNKRLLIK